MKRILIGIAVIVTLVVSGIIGTQINTSEPPGARLAANQPALAGAPNPGADNQSSAGARPFPTTVEPDDAEITPGVPDPVAPTGDREAFARTATLSLTTKDIPKAQGRIDEVIRNAGAIVLRAGQNESSYTVSMRVPADKLDALTSELRGIGTLDSYDANADDLSGVLADNEARTRNAQAREAALLALLPQAKNASESADLQRQLTTVRDEIESLQAVRRASELRVRTSVLSVTVATESQRYVEPKPEPMLARAWDVAVRTVLTVLGGLLVLGAGLLPIVALVLILTAAIRLALRRRRTPQPPTASAAA